MITDTVAKFEPLFLSKNFSNPRLQNAFCFEVIENKQRRNFEMESIPQNGLLVNETTYKLVLHMFWGIFRLPRLMRCFYISSGKQTMFTGLTTGCCFVKEFWQP